MEAENEYQNALMFGGITSNEIMVKGGGDDQLELSDDDLKLFDEPS